jgi:hypothetical protein
MHVDAKARVKTAASTIRTSHPVSRGVRKRMDTPTVICKNTLDISDPGEKTQTDNGYNDDYQDDVSCVNIGDP